MIVAVIMLYAPMLPRVVGGFGVGLRRLSEGMVMQMKPGNRPTGLILQLAAAAVVAILDQLADAVSVFEAGPEEWRVEAWPAASVLTPTVVAQMAVAAAAAAGALLDISEEKLSARDWLAENQLDFPPMRVGRFFIHGSHHQGRVPAGTIAITIDAARKSIGSAALPSATACFIRNSATAR